MLSAGFLAITFIAILLVIAPDVVFYFRGWRSGGFGRVITLTALALLVILVRSAFTDSEAVDFESRAFSLYVTWGFTLYIGGAVYVCFWLIHRLIKKRRM